MKGPIPVLIATTCTLLIASSTLARADSVSDFAPPTVKRILSIDGGGIRGIIPAEVLLSLEKIIQNKTGDCSAIIGDYFDFVAGTSTGGIMTLAVLAGKSASQIVDIWSQNGGYIFSDSHYFGAKYSPDNLVTVLKRELGAETKMSSFQKPHVVTSFDIESYAPHLFTPASYDNNDFLAWQCGRATSAAPTYFPTFQVNSSSGNSYNLVDGGVMANNPAQLALTQAMKHFQDYNPANFIMLSLGTGENPVTIEGSKDWGDLDWLEESKGNIIGLMETAPMMINVDTAQDMFANDHEKQFLRIQYNTVQGVIGGCRDISFKMDDASASNIQNLQTCGQALAEKHNSSLQHFSQMLIQKTANAVDMEGTDRCSTSSIQTRSPRGSPRRRETKAFAFY